jgi:hypothetical protein
MGLNQIQAVSPPISPEYVNGPEKISGRSARETIAQSSAPEDAVKITVRSQADFIQLHKVNEQMNSAALGQRLFQRQLQQADDSIERMKAHLGRIIKQFPPYPLGSDDRMRALRAYAGCRKLIDQLTVPPPDDELEPRTVAGSAASVKAPES